VNQVLLKAENSWQVELISMPELVAFSDWGGFSSKMVPDDSCGLLSSADTFLAQLPPYHRITD